jgi:hypothetical protein
VGAGAEPEQEEDGSSWLGRFGAIVAFIAIIAAIHFGSEWLEKRREEKNKPTVPASERFTIPPAPQTEKGEFTRTTGADGADAPEGLEELLGEVLTEGLQIHGGAPAGGSVGAGGVIPPVPPGEFLFVSIRALDDCDAVIERLALEIAIENGYEATGDLFAGDGSRVLCHVVGALTPAGQLDVSCRLDEGGIVALSGQVGHDPNSVFLPGNGTFTIEGQGPSGYVHCSGRWESK